MIGGHRMQLINSNEVQSRLSAWVNTPLYIHLELTTGAYTAHHDKNAHPAANFIRNAIIQYSAGSIQGNETFRVGLKLEHGWVYAEGLTHYAAELTDQLVLAGINKEGKLVVALQLSTNPF